MLVRKLSNSASIWQTLSQQKGEAEARAGEVGVEVSAVAEVEMVGAVEWGVAERWAMVVEAVEVEMVQAVPMAAMAGNKVWQARTRPRLLATTK